MERDIIDGNIGNRFTDYYAEALDIAYPCMPKEKKQEMIHKHNEELKRLKESVGV